MKKLTFALACSSTLALLAAPIHTATFENIPLGTVGVGGKTDTGDSVGDIYWQYQGDGGDASTVKDYGPNEGQLPAPSGPQLSGTPGSNYLELSTEGGTLWRSVNAGATLEGETAAAPKALSDTDNGFLYIDTMVQFTATEDGNPPEVGEQDKLAIWLDAPEGGEKQLCVLASAYDYDGGEMTQPATKFVLTPADGNPLAIEPGAWYRLSVKALTICQGEITIQGFEIRVDGKLMKTTTADPVGAGLADALGELIGEANLAKIAQNTLFPSLQTMGGEEDVPAITAVGFKGSGALDDVVVTADELFAEAAPVDFAITTAEGVTASWSTSPDGAFTDYAEGQKAPAGKIYVKLTTADGGVKIVERTVDASGSNVIDLTSLTANDWSWYLGDAVEGAYVIDDETELVKLAEKAATLGTAGITFKLGADVALTATATPIGTGNNKDKLGDEATYKAGAFQGTFDGQNHTISGIELARADYTGVFGSAYGATIKNTKFAIKEGGTGFAAAGDTADFCGGVVCGVAVKTTIENCEVLAGTFTAQKAAAGIVGYAAGGTVLKDCVNRANVTSLGNEKVAGLVGCVQNSGNYTPAEVVIDGCSNYGNIECKASGKTRAALLLSYTDMAVKLQGTIVARGTVTQAGSTSNIQSIVNINGGSVTVAAGATITAPAGMKSTIHNGKAHAGLNYATVADGVATFVADSAAANGANLKVMTTGNTITLPNVGDSITLDMSLATATVTTTDTEANEVVQNGNVWTVQAKTVAVTGVTLDKTEVADAKVGDEITLVATVAPENATDKTVTWETSDAEVATVANGVVTVLKAGTVTITAKAGDKSATCAITATAAYPDYIGTDTAKQAKYDAWAKTYGADTASAYEKAYLLNVAPAAAEAAEKEFVITSIAIDAEGNVTVTTPEGKNYNGTVEIQGATTLEGPWAPKAAGHKFFKAILK